MEIENNIRHLDPVYSLTINVFVCVFKIALQVLNGKPYFLGCIASNLIVKHICKVFCLMDGFYETNTCGNLWHHILLVRGKVSIHCLFNDIEHITDSI